MASKSIAARLHRARVFISNATKSSELLALVAPFGYTAAVLHAQLGKNKAASDAYDAKGDLEGEQEAASKRARETYELSRAQYDHYRGIGLVIFRGPDKHHLRSLGINRKAPRSISGYITAARHFFRGAQNNPEIAAKFAAVGVTAQQMEQAENLVDQYETFCEDHRLSIGVTIGATIALKAAMEEHDNWFLLFRRTTKHMTRNQPKLFELLLAD